MKAVAAQTASGPARAQGRYLTGFDTAALPARACEVLVVGSGIAGLVAALEAARFAQVLLVTKGALTETATWYAQGGIAGAVGEADSIELHKADTLVVGQGLCDPAVVRAVVSEAAEALGALAALGVAFTRTAAGAVDLTREGGHSLPRVLHTGDATGAGVQAALTEAVRATAGIEIVEHAFLLDLLTDDGRCVGALVREHAAAPPTAIFAGATVLATGGCGQVYRVTTNPAVATGDGIAAAWRAGAEIADMEFVQFHPTALDSSASPRFLITEALRGEGAYLLDCDHQRFMLGVHPLAELGPRDIVSREIEQVMARCHRPNVWLDARHLGEEYLRARFPTIWDACIEAGFDLSRDLVPVAPAAHYLVGGVLVDVDGRSSLPGLFASGEVASSGLHGANRLASNSLLEGLVFSRRIGRELAGEDLDPHAPHIVGVAAGPGSGGEASADVRARMQALMSSRVAMTRDAAGLAEAADALAAAADSLAPDGLAAAEARNLLTVADLIVTAARYREESRGTHFRADFPARDDARWRVRTVWRRDTLEPREVPVLDRVTAPPEGGAA